jgi:hypothetical protein
VTHREDEAMTPQELARYYDRSVAAAAEWPWRNPEACAFADWLAGFWAPACPVAPAGPPAATSVSEGRADGIRWFVTGGAILGYVAGHARGCYRVPSAAQPPSTLGENDHGD